MATLHQLPASELMEGDRVAVGDDLIILVEVTVEGAVTAVLAECADGLVRPFEFASGADVDMIGEER